MVNAAYGDPVRMFSDGMDDFVMDEKTLKTTPGVAVLQSVAMTTMSRRGVSLTRFRTSRKS
jgi:hypothetical protein